MSFVRHEEHGVVFLKVAKKKSLHGVKQSDDAGCNSSEQNCEARFSEKLRSESFLEDASKCAREYGVSRVTSFLYGKKRMLEVHFESGNDIDIFLKSLKDGKYQLDLQQLLEKEKDLEVKSLRLEVHPFLTIPSDDAWVIKTIQAALERERRRDESGPAADQVVSAERGMFCTL